MIEKMVSDVKVTLERHDAGDDEKSYTVEKPVCDSCTDKSICVEYLPGALCIVDRGQE